MSVLIKGIEMPQDGEMRCINIYPDGKVCIALDLECTQIATAVPVPPHGRLIDADALNEAMARMVPWAIADPTAIAFLDGLSAAYEAIQASPTIIPAEE